MKNYILILFLIMSLRLFSQNIDIINPIKDIGIKNWRMVNDNVMGGGDARTCLMDAIVSVAPMGVDKERLWKEMVRKIQGGRDTSMSDVKEELGNHGLVTKTVTREYIKKGDQRTTCSKTKNARS